MGLIVRWRATQVRPAPRQSAPGAMVGQVCALGAVSGGFSALGAVFCYFSALGAIFCSFSAPGAASGVCIDTVDRYFCAEGANWRNSFLKSNSFLLF